MRPIRKTLKNRILNVLRGSISPLDVVKICELLNLDGNKQAELSLVLNELSKMVSSDRSKNNVVTTLNDDNARRYMIAPMPMKERRPR